MYKPLNIYLDVCCFNRPFDDQLQDRVRLESEAILTILSYCQAGNWLLLGSEVIEMEVAKIHDDDRRYKVGLFLCICQTSVSVDEEVYRRATELESLSFKAFDALHVACAEKGGATVLLTTDDKLLRKALKHKKNLNIRLKNPVNWLMEEVKK